jgi:TonB family protein
MSFAASAPRFALGAPLALLVTLALGALMQTLIAQPPVETEDPPPIPKFDIVSRIVDTPPDVRRPPAPPDVVTPPDPVQIRPEPGKPAADGPGVTYDLPEIEPGVPETGAMWVARAPRRLVTPIPIFPQNVRADGGSCTIGFDVLTDGSTANVAVISCTNSGFARSAMTAVKDTRYEPGYGESGPVVTTGMSLEIVFRLEN